MDECLWPARNVAEYAYCPRLFYLMEVEGIHLPSEDTEQGNRVHKRVDSPSSEAVLEKATAGAASPASVRSLTLTSARLGLTATLDLAELSGTAAVPVEYRKGRSRRADAAEGEGAASGPWPTDRIQVGLQSLLLEEAGYAVPHAVLYYAAEKRRLQIAVDDALRKESLQTLAAARQCAAGPRPLPLEADPRCPRCSLQPICLPDEVNFQRAGGNVALRPRTIWPPRDDGIHVVAQQAGAKVGVRGSAMYVTDKEGHKATDVPLANVESLSLLGGVQISTQAIQTLADRGIPDIVAHRRRTALCDDRSIGQRQCRSAQGPGRAVSTIRNAGCRPREP